MLHPTTSQFLDDRYEAARQAPASDFIALMSQAYEEAWHMENELKPANQKQVSTH